MKIRGKLKTGRVWLDGKELDPKASQAVVNHSPDGFSWGYPGSGPSQLALAILLEVTGEKEVALSLYQQFKFDVVARWPQGDFEGNVDVIGWLNEHDVEIITAPDWKDLEEEKVFSFTITMSATAGSRRISRKGNAAILRVCTTPRMECW